MREVAYNLENCHSPARKTRSHGTKTLSKMIIGWPPSCDPPVARKVTPSALHGTAHESA
jgi:hypothetical protein